MATIEITTDDASKDSAIDALCWKGNYQRASADDDTAAKEEFAKQMMLTLIGNVISEHQTTLVQESVQATLTAADKSIKQGREASRGNSSVKIR